MKTVELTRDWLLARCDQQVDGCWLWNRACTKEGYGKVTTQSNNRIRYASAHRVSHELFIGPIPDGLLVLHNCDVRRCINPAHLFLGTHQENTQDAANKGRLQPPPTGKGLQRKATWKRGKVTEEQVSEIQLLKGKMRQCDIAALFKVSVTLIRRIHNGKRKTRLAPKR